MASSGTAILTKASHVAVETCPARLAEVPRVKVAVERSGEEQQ